MREIKFRIWDITEKEMIYPNLYWFEEEGVREVPGDARGYQVMQFTGLQDKSGKDIYEGDIVVDARWDARFEVKWCDGKGEYLGGQLGWILDDERFCDVGHTTELEAYLRWDETSSKEEYYNGHVIGNIYEHPELLQKAGNP